MEVGQSCAGRYAAVVARKHRRDLFPVGVSPDRVIELAADPTRFGEFNPLVRVPPGSGRVEQIGNVYYQIFGFGPIRLSTRWETISVDPVGLADRPLPAPPWTTVEVGQMPLFGRVVSTTRYDSVRSGTLITHDFDYGVPAGLPGRVVDLMLMRPLLSLGFRWLGRRLRRWIENG